MRSDRLRPEVMAVVCFGLFVLVFLFLAQIAEVGGDLATHPDLSECPVSTLFGPGARP